MQQCFAYEILKKQIGQQCETYVRLHRKGDLGRMPGMYERNEEVDKDIPSDTTSAFLRGGIIDVMACFEAYIWVLLDQAAKTILYKQKKCPETCEDCIQLKHDHVVLENEQREHGLQRNQKKAMEKKICTATPTWANIEEAYKKKFQISSFFEELLSVGELASTHPQQAGNEHELKPMTYCYSIKADKISKLCFEQQSDVFLHAMLNFCYGIRCVMAHGNASKTLDTGVLENFPTGERRCQQQKCNPPCSICKLKQIATLSDHFTTCIEEQGMGSVVKSRLYPKPKPLKKLRNVADSKAALEIVKEFFPDLCNGPNGKENPHFKSKKELDGNYALYHICRTYTYLKENKRSMYITYRVLVRINQFISILAHRMRMAVGRILIYKYGLPDGTWGVIKSKPDQIREIIQFEKDHQETVLMPRHCYCDFCSYYS